MLYMGTAMIKTFSRILVLFVAALTCGCQRAEVFDLAKNGAGVVYALGNTGLSTWFHIASEEYHAKYDTMLIMAAAPMAASDRGTVMMLTGGFVYTHFGDYGSAWASLPGPPAGLFSIAPRHDEILVLNNTDIYRLHSDSYQQSIPWTEVVNIGPALGAFTPRIMFRDADSDAVYIAADDGVNICFFLFTGAGVQPVITPSNGPFPVLAGVIFAARKGGYFYLGNPTTIYQMSSVDPLGGWSYATVINALSYAVADDGMYYVGVSAGMHFFHINEITTLSDDLRTFSLATTGAVMPFRGDKVAIMVKGPPGPPNPPGPEDGVWIYDSGEFEHIVSAWIDGIYSR
jgi:hypothetical protein